MCGTDFASYVDDNTPYVSGDSIDDIIKSLEDLDNQMKANSDTCRLISSKLSCMNLKIVDKILKTVLVKKCWALR